MMKVTYLGHSGFFVEMEDACFLFDYYKGELPEADRGKKLFVFVSHGHYDHYRKEIFSLRDQYDQVRCLISSDIFVREAEDILSVKPNEETEVLGCRIRTLRSTDEGVAFLLKYRGRTIYHAGDLNWWHWNEESDAFNNMIKRQYTSEINKIKGMSVDIGFVPVDTRLGDKYILAIDYLMRNVDIKHIFPMHFWKDYRIFDLLKGDIRTKEYRDRIMRIEGPGQVFEL